MHLLPWGAAGGLALSVVSDTHHGLVRWAQPSLGWEGPLGASGPTPAQSMANLTARWSCQRLIWVSEDAESCPTNRTSTRNGFARRTPAPNLAHIKVPLLLQLGSITEMLGRPLLSVTPLALPTAFPSSLALVEHHRAQRRVFGSQEGAAPMKTEPLGCSFSAALYTGQIPANQGCGWVISDIN